MSVCVRLIPCATTIYVLKLDTVWGGGKKPQTIPNDISKVTIESGPIDCGPDVSRLCYLRRRSVTRRSMHLSITRSIRRWVVSFLDCSAPNRHRQAGGGDLRRTGGGQNVPQTTRLRGLRPYIVAAQGSAPSGSQRPTLVRRLPLPSSRCFDCCDKAEGAKQKKRKG